MGQKTFNLLYEPWIMVLKPTGETEEVSLLTALERAHEFRCLAGELPTQDAAVLRLLLAALYATFSRTDEKGVRKPLNNAQDAFERWENLWKLRQFPIEPIKTRLCHYEEHFYLFHPERPFYQVAGLDRGTVYGAAKLLGNLSEGGNKVRLFPVRTGNAKESITYAEAARWLLHLNGFDDSSGKPSIRGQKMSSPGIGWLGKLGLVYAHCSNLFETLMLNFVLLNDKDEPWSTGFATWELAEQRKNEREEIVPPKEQLSLLTLQSRRLLLQRVGSSVIGYRLLGGDFFQEENAFSEQMTLWRKDAKKDIYTPRRHDFSKQLWRDFPSLLADEEGSRKPGVVSWLSRVKERGYVEGMVTLQIAGVRYDQKKCSITDVFQDSLTINANILSRLGKGWVIRIIKLLSLTENCVRQLSFLVADLAKASGDSDSAHHRAGEGGRNAARTEAYFRLDMPFRRWLTNIDPARTDIDGAEQEWKEIVKQVLLQLGEELTIQSGEKAIAGRWLKKKLYTAPGALTRFRSILLHTIEKGGA